MVHVTAAWLGTAWKSLRGAVVVSVILTDRMTVALPGAIPDARRPLARGAQSLLRHEGAGLTLTRRMPAEEASSTAASSNQTSLGADSATMDGQGMIASLALQGVVVADAVQVGQMRLGGALVRGLSVKDKVEPWNALLKVPRHMMLGRSSVPELENLALTGGACGLMDADSARFLDVLALAIETRKGNASKWRSYIVGLPSLSDYRTYHPLKIEHKLINAFKSLPIVRVAQFMRAADENKLACLKELQAKDTPVKSMISSISRDDWELAGLRYNTRCYGGVVFTADPYQNRSWLIPVSDMANTAVNESVNLLWQFDKDVFSAHTGPTAIPAGSELYESYCDGCNNDLMMLTWGVYMEENYDDVPTPMSRFQVSCNEQLRQASLSALSSLDPEDMTAPRCKDEVLADDQGPLRCNLARLAYEKCADVWFNLWDKKYGDRLSSQIDGFENAASRAFIQLEDMSGDDVLGGAEGLTRTAALLRQIAIKSVHPALLRHGLFAGAM